MPEKVYIALPAIERLIAPKIKGYHRDHLKEVLSIVARHCRKDKEAAPLVMKYIKRLVPQGDRYLRELIKWDIIERTGYYVPGQAAYQYQFAEGVDGKYITCGLNNLKLIRRIEKVFSESRQEMTRQLKDRTDQVRFLKLLSIASGYENFINEKYSADTDAYNRALGSAVRILNGDIFYSVDTTSGRFHSNVTNTPAGFRPYLRVGGQPLVNIDVKNCQPYLSTVILTDPQKAAMFSENPAFTMVLQSLKVSQADDVKKYIQLVIEGRIYEYLMAAFHAEELYLDRNETKRQVLRILFARNRMPKNPVNDSPEKIARLTPKQQKKREAYIEEYENIKKARQIFRRNFPTVHRIFSKVRGNERGDKFTSFKRFAVLLQSMESYLMLEVILKRIRRELPEVIAISVHDSIMTGVLTNDAEAVKNILIEEFTNFVGFRPKVKLEREEEEREREGGDIREGGLYIQYDATTSVMINNSMN